MVDERGDAVSVNHVFTVYQSKKICTWGVFVNVIRLRISQARACIFSDDRPLLYRCGGVNAVGVNL